MSAQTEKKLIEVRGFGEQGFVGEKTEDIKTKAIIYYLDSEKIERIIEFTKFSKSKPVQVRFSNSLDYFIVRFDSSKKGEITLINSVSGDSLHYFNDSIEYSDMEVSRDKSELWVSSKKGLITPISKLT
jgi:hypothetical protein